MRGVLGVIAIGIIACGVFLVSDKFGSMPELVDDHPAPRLPESDFTAENLADVRFATVMRGYAPHQVDELLDRAIHSLKGDSVARPMTGADLATAAFTVVGRGYQMAQVDLVIQQARQPSWSSQALIRSRPGRDERPQRAFVGRMRNNGTVQTRSSS